MCYGLKKHGAHWCHLANTTEPSMCGGDATLCQITLTTCFDNIKAIYTSAQRVSALISIDASYTNNRMRLSVPCYLLAPCNNRKHTAHGHHQAASQASTDFAWRHSVWLPHSSLGFQRPVGRRSYRLTPQATIEPRDCGLCSSKRDRKAQPCSSNVYYRTL